MNHFEKGWGTLRKRMVQRFQTAQRRMEKCMQGITEEAEKKPALDVR